MNGKNVHLLFDALLFGIFFCLSTQAAIITVSTLDDSGPGSLRQAIVDAAPDDSIDFAVAGTIVLTSGELTIGKNLYIAGPGWNVLTISGNNAARIFRITNGTVAISGLTLASGRDSGAPSAGGGVYNSGTLWLFDSTITGNRAESSGANDAYGGGIFNENILHIQTSTFSNNMATAPDGTAMGAGIYTSSGSTLDISQSTITSNEVRGMPAIGGGISQPFSGGGTVTITNTTVEGNSAEGLIFASDGFAGGMYGDENASIVHCTVVANFSDHYAGGLCSIGSSGPSVQNSIVANNFALTGPDIYTAISSLDYNLIEDISGVTITGETAHNLYNQDPMLNSLGPYGGATWTCSVLDGSPALDCIPSSSCPVYNDQRGVIRPQHDVCEIGAYEKSWFAAIYVSSSIPGPTNADSISFMVSFNHLAINFNEESDLIITETGTVAHTGSSGFAGGMNFMVSIDGVTGDGTLAITVSADSDVENPFGEPLNESVTSIPVVIDNTGPGVAISPPSPPATVSGPVEFTLTYLEANSISLAVSDIVVQATGSVTAGTVAVNGSGNMERTVTVSDISGTGSLSISISCCTAEDVLGNPALPAGPSDACLVNTPAVPIHPWTFLIIFIALGLLMRFKSF